MDDPWESHAAWWQKEFTEGADPEYVEQILPLIEANLIEADRPGSGRVLDIGCGEGQVSRLAAVRGPLVVGVDPAHAQVAAAVERGGGPSYVQAGADALPWGDSSMDLAVACLVFEHICALDAAIAEVARVLRSGGRFLLLLNHPLLQTPGSAWIDDHTVDPPEMYWRVGPYLRESDTIEEVQKGVFIRFFHRPLSRYLNAAAANNLMLERMEEPAPPPGFLAGAPGYAQAEAIPRLLFLRFAKV